MLLYVLMMTCVFPTPNAVVIDAYPNTAMVEQGTTLVLVCRVVGVPSTTVLSYQWTCPGGSCDAGAVDPQWAARIQQGNILVVNVRNASGDGGDYTCRVMANEQLVGTTSYTVAVKSELYNLCVLPWHDHGMRIWCSGCQYICIISNEDEEKLG